MAEIKFVNRIDCPAVTSTWANMTELYPTALTRLDDGRLAIIWSDGEVRHYSPRELRDACPCATCREQRSAPLASASQLPVLSLAETQPLRIAGMKPVGGYAYGIEFSDGHDTGIFTLERLRELGATAAST